MAQVVWTSNALSDLNEIGEYIANDSPKYAELNPRTGWIVPEAEREDLRELIEGNYRIIYEILNDMPSF